MWQRKCAVCRTKSYASNVTLIDWTTNHKFHIWYVAIFKLFSFRLLSVFCINFWSPMRTCCCKDVIPYLQVDRRVCDLIGFDIATCSWFTCLLSIFVIGGDAIFVIASFISKVSIARRQAYLHIPKIVSSLQITSHEVDNDVRLRSRTASKWKKKHSSKYHSFNYTSNQLLGAHWQLVLHESKRKWNGNTRARAITKM